jgi:uncharacterized protein
VDVKVEGVCADADDEKFLSCAMAANAGVPISGDNHLLDLIQFQSVRILTAREFYEENIRKVSQA